MLDSRPRVESHAARGDIPPPITDLLFARKIATPSGFPRLTQPDLHATANMTSPDFGRIAALLEKLEAMCQRARELRAELESARNRRQSWPGSREANNSFEQANILTGASRANENVK